MTRLFGTDTDADYFFILINIIISYLNTNRSIDYDIGDY